MVWLVDFHVHFSLPLSKRADSKRAHQQRTLGGWGEGGTEVPSGSPAPGVLRSAFKYDNCSLFKYGNYYEK